MRAIITDIRAGKAAALAEDGTVHLVDAKNRAVGQEIRIPAKHRRRWKKPLTWAACVAVLCGMATTGVYAAYEPYASVSITVTSRSSGHAERLREHIDDRFRQSGDERNPPEVRVQPPHDTGNAPGESRQSESAEQA